MVKKYKIGKHFRLAIISICVAIILLISVQIIIEYKFPKYEETKIELYTYTNKSDLSHNVSFKPNPLYEEGAPTDGDVYLTSYIDSLTATFLHQFKGEREGEIAGKYKIIAELEGYLGEKETSKTLWKKTFVLVPETEFHEFEKELSIEKDVILDIRRYNNFAENIRNESKLSTQVKLIAYMDIDFKVVTNKGTIEKKQTPTLVMPLNSGFIEISKTIPEDDVQAIVETRLKELPVNKNRIMIYGVCLGFAIITLLSMILLVGGRDKELFIKYLDKIFKKHGNRLIALESYPREDFATAKSVKTIDDLVRIADEINKPIMYKYNNNPTRITEFFLLDGRSSYLFDLKNYISILEMDARIKQDRKKRIKI